MTLGTSSLSINIACMHLIIQIAQEFACLAIKDMFHCQNPEDSSYIDGVVNDSLRTIIYDMQGRRTDHIQKGLNMIHMSDGKTKKVIMLNLR